MDADNAIHPIANTADLARIADIVFVHGLGGNWHGTWTHPQDNAPSSTFYWPAELGKDFRQCGVWSVGYAAGVTKIGRPGMIISKRAGNLALKLANVGLGERPLFFICHSMGGLVVKSLLVDASTLPDPDRKMIAKATKGIVFCGTPHRGSAFANAAQLLERLVGGIQLHVKEMRAHQDELDMMHDKFIEWHRHCGLAVESYAENQKLFGIGVVVPRDSANPNITGYRTVDVDADHLSLVKPNERTHDVYAGVLRFLTPLLKSLSSESAGSSSKKFVPAEQFELAPFIKLILPHSERAAMKVFHVHEILRRWSDSVPLEIGYDRMAQALARLSQLLDEDLVRQGQVTYYEIYLTVLSVICSCLGSEHVAAWASIREHLFSRLDIDIVEAARHVVGERANMHERCGRLSDHFLIGPERVRPRVIVSLTRLAFVLDDFEPKGYFSSHSKDATELIEKFKGRILGVRPLREKRRIEVDIRFDSGDVSELVEYAGEERSFAFAFVEHLTAVEENWECLNYELPDALRFQGLLVRIFPAGPLRAPMREFMFGPRMQAHQFISQCTELINDRSEPNLVSVNLMFSHGKFEIARAELESLYRCLDSLSVRVRDCVIYNLACAYALLGRQPGSSKTGFLDTAIQRLTQWSEEGLAGAWHALGRDPIEALRGMLNDVDLVYLIDERRESFIAILTNRYVHLLPEPRSVSGMGSHCVSLGSFIDVPHGQMPVEQLVAGDQVVGIEISKYSVSRVATKIVRIQVFDVGHYIKINDRASFSETQPLFIKGRGWASAADLKEGMEVLNSEGAFEIVWNIHRVSNATKVFALSTEHRSHTYVASGLVLHNKVI